MSICISETFFDALRLHSEESYPCECCGILLGKTTDGCRVVQDVVRCANVHQIPQSRYEIEPRELVRVQREARQRDLEMIGFYHSHPDHPARWSETDLHKAHWIDCSYVITSVEHGRAGETRSFLLAGRLEECKYFEDEPLQIMQE